MKRSELMRQSAYMSSEHISAVKNSGACLRPRQGILPSQYQNHFEILSTVGRYVQDSTMKCDKDCKQKVGIHHGYQSSKNLGYISSQQSCEIYESSTQQDDCEKKKKGKDYLSKESPDLFITIHSFVEASFDSQCEVYL